MKINYHFIIFIALILVIAALNFLVELNAYTPDYLEEDLNVTTIKQPNFKIVDFSTGFFTIEEHCIDEQNNQIMCHQLQDVQNGDILVTKSTHTLFYRHGHAGIVIDAEAGLVLEATGYGVPSALEPLEKWNYYPTVKVLRLNDRNDEIINHLIETALTDYLELDYHLFASKTNNNVTQCSDIVWKVFNELGYDLDSDGGYVVTPEDISHSELLHVVESYGFSNNNSW